MLGLMRHPGSRFLTAWRAGDSGGPDRLVIAANICILRTLLHEMLALPTYYQKNGTALQWIVS